MKRYLLILSALACGYAYSATQYNYQTNDATNIDWSDITGHWTETTIGDNRDKYYININNATAANVYVRGGSTVNISDGGSMYLQNDTRLIIGDAEGDQISTMHFETDGTKDTFLEITGRSSVLVNKNGVLTMDANRPIRYWNYSNQLPDDFVAFMVDGGTVNGSINPGVNANNNGKVNVVFKNGATLNRNTEVNPLGMNAKSSFTFDNSTYNVWNEKNIAYYESGAVRDYGWGNHSMNTGAYNQDIQQTVTITNGSVWKGAGVVDLDNKEVTYYDFSEDITASGMSGADLTLQVGYGTKEDNYFKFQILNGGKVSAKNVILSSQENSRSLQTMGSFTFEMQSDSADNMARLAAFGGTYMNLARTNAESTWSNNFLMKGNSKYQIAGGFAIGRNEDFGGTANLVLSGNNNIFQLGGNLSIIPGWNTANESNAVVNITTEDATNSVFQTNGFNVYSHFNSQVDVKFLGKTNTVSFTNSDFNMYSSQYAGNSTATVEIGTAQFTSSRNFHLRDYVSGDQKMIFSNGVQATIGSAQLYVSGTAGSTATSYYVIKDGSSLTTTNDNGYGRSSGSANVSGEVGFLLEGNGSSFISKGQMNINPTNEGNVGGVYAIRLHGTNGLFEAQKNLHFTGLLQGNDAMYLLEMKGSGNTANINTFNFGNNNSTAGTYRFYSKSDSAENKNTLKLTNTTISMEGQMVANSTAKREYILAGNTVLRSNTGDALILKVHEYAGRVFLSGNALFEISGSGNDVLFSQMLFGNGAATGGTATLRIVGGGSSIVANTFRMMRGATTSLANPVGGILEYQLNDTGISAIQINNNIDGNVLNGLLKVDFTGMQGNYEKGRFVLMSAKESNLKNYISQYWYDFDLEAPLENMDIIARGLEDEKIKFAVEDSSTLSGYKDFVVYYTGTAVIPEPSTCAAILGALAIAFTLYRRRK